MEPIFHPEAHENHDPYLTCAICARVRRTKRKIKPGRERGVAGVRGDGHTRGRGQDARAKEL